MRTSKGSYRNIKRILCVFCAVLLLSALAGCQKKDAARLEFPLSEEALAGALEELGLSWTVEDKVENVDGADRSVSYSLHRPDSGVDFNTLFINTYETEEYGRRLQLSMRVPEKDVYDEGDPAWENWWETEDWKAAIRLAAHLYGGFEDDEELYDAYSAEELPAEDYILWEGMLTGGYCRITTSELIGSWRPSDGTTLEIHIYESEEYVPG